jgi:hypothetical protein
MAISGTIKMVEMRFGAALPIAGVRIVSTDGKTAAEFQLRPPSAHEHHFNIMLGTVLKGVPDEIWDGQIDATAAISFRLAVSESGKVTLLIGGQTFSTQTTPITSGYNSAYCSTGEFRFSDLNFGVASDPTKTTP